MMAPTLALDADGVVLAAGAAGGTRLRSALLEVVAGILDEGLEPQAAIDRPRVHPAGAIVHLEPGFGPDTIAALESAGFELANAGTRGTTSSAASASSRGPRPRPTRDGTAPPDPVSQGRVAARVRSTSRAIWSINACSLSKDCSSRSRSQSSTISRRP